MPSLQRLHEDLIELNGAESICKNKRLEVGSAFTNYDPEREDECGIFLEGSTKLVLPNCCHAMCINCICDWNTRSESCPFCPGSIKREKSRDLWVLTCGDDMVDADTVSKEDLSLLSLRPEPSK